ncbi:hypothetical protein M9H77_19356 [Catharanthus roseus]|uniref:Uncharacterized protein n=1 Tax=Catharanthus roseus TaxID=4058 RepID=A0ACC0BAD4_CATRO|nr:hypothetical protein M9H77_19356 [Catharanthus roseus]
MCGYPFKLKSEQMTMCDNWQLFVHDGRHNHAICVYNHGNAQATKLSEEQMIQTEQFRKSHVPPHNILQFFHKQNVGCAVSYVPLLLIGYYNIFIFVAQKIYSLVAKIKKNRMQGGNTICVEIKRASEIIEKYVRVLFEDIAQAPMFMRVGYTEKDMDIDFEMRDLADLLDQIMVSVRVLALDLVRVQIPVKEADRHELLRVGVEGISVDGIVYLLL